MSCRRFACWFAATLLVVGAAARSPGPQVVSPKKDQPDDYKLFQILVDTMDQVERNYVKEVSRRELIEAAIEGVLHKLDPYSNYIGPAEMEEFRSSVESSFGGIGIQIGMDRGRLTVISPLVGTPAYRAGLLAGDQIVQINGKPTEGLTMDEAIRRLKGETGTTVALTVIHPGQSKKTTVQVTREQVHVETVLGDRRTSDDAWDFMLDPKRRIGYVRVLAFSRDTAEALRGALEDLRERQMRGLVLDLRFNPGGLLSSAIEVADLFIAHGRIVSTSGRNAPEKVWDAKEDGAFEDVPMVVLVNRYSASAAEIVAACLQDHHRALVMGERTWGKGSVQNVVELEHGLSALKLTTASYRRPSGKNIHRFPGDDEKAEWGVQPDKGYELRLNDYEMLALLHDRRQRDVVRHEQSAPAEEGDPQFKDRLLETALDYLSGKTGQGK